MSSLFTINENNKIFYLFVTTKLIGISTIYVTVLTEYTQCPYIIPYLK